MKSKTYKLLIFLLFIGVLLGVGLWLNFSFVKGHSTIEMQPTSNDELKSDSTIEIQLNH